VQPDLKRPLNMCFKSGETTEAAVDQLNPDLSAEVLMMTVPAWLGKLGFDASVSLFVRSR
jgi:hypothetical protein